MSEIRVQARSGVVDAVRRDGVAAAFEHGSSAPHPRAESGDRIVVSVRLPHNAVVETGGSFPPGSTLVVEGVHRRAHGWAYASHRVALYDGRGDVPLLASRWAPGNWAGDSVLRSEFEPGLPTEAGA